MATDTETGKISVTEVTSLLLMAAGLWECGLGWMQLLGLRASLHSLYPATGTFYNPGPYCGFLAMVLPVALRYALDGRRFRPLHWAALVYVVAAVAIMPVLMGRTGWVAAAAGCLLTAAGSGRIRRPRPAVLVGAVAAAIAAVAFLLYLKPASALGRLFLWRMGVSAMLRHPLTGAGSARVAGELGAAQEAYFREIPWSVYIPVAATPEYAFNEYLQTGIAYGIPAMLLLVAVMVLAGVSAWRGRAYGLAGGMLSLAIVCFSSYPFQFPVFIAAAAVLTAGAIVAAPRRCVAGKAAVCAAIGIVAFTACRQQMRRSEIADSWSTMRYICQYRLDEATIHRLDSLDGIYGESARFLFDYGKALREAGLYEKSSAVLHRGVEVSSDPMFLTLLGRNCHDTGDYGMAAHYFRKAIDRLPDRIYPHYLLALHYADPAVNDTASFLKMGRYALFLKPKVMSPAIRQMRHELDSLITLFEPRVEGKVRQR